MADNLIALTIFVSLLSSLSHVQPKPHDSPYLSPTILLKNYNKMLDTLKIYNYSPPNSFNFTSPAQSLFHSSLLQSPFLTLNPNEAHLFFLPFPSDFSARSLTRHVASIRTDLPYWNRALGADHFFLSHSGIGHYSDRNLVELKKNSIQISSFPADADKFIPHKDVTLPPLNTSPLQIPSSLGNNKTSATIYIRSSELLNSDIVSEVIDDPGFVVETERFGSSKYCLFEYGGEMSWLGLALASGCVPVLMTDRPIQDLPLMDVLRWSEIALFIGSNGGAERLKVILGGISEEKYEKMRELGVTASQHLVWNASPQPLDAFHMVLYQLWLRRHTIRYTRRE